MRRVSILFIVVVMMIQMFLPFSVEAQSQSTFTRNPIPYWTGDFNAEYVNNNYVRLLSRTENLTVYEKALGYELVYGTLYYSYTNTHEDDGLYFVCKNALSGSYYFSYFGVLVDAPDNYTRFKFTITAKISSTSGIYIKDAYYNNHSAQARIAVPFTELTTYDVTKSWTIEDPQMKCVSQLGLFSFGLKVVWTVPDRYADIDYIGVEFDSEKYAAFNNTIVIPLIENQERYSLQTMIQRVDTYENDTMMLRLNTTGGLFNNLKYVLNTSDIIRFTWEIKNSINVYRLIISDADNRVLQRIQFPYAPSKHFTSLFLNYSRHSGEWRVYYLTGELDYENVREFEMIENDTEWWTDWISSSFYCRITKDSSDLWTISSYRLYECQMDNFQYLRTLIEWNKYSTDGACWLCTTAYLIIYIDDYTLTFRVDSDAGSDYETFSMVEIKQGSSTVFVLYSENGPTTSTGRCAVKIWRTLDNHLGIAFSSESNLFRYSSDTRRTIEDFTYYFITNINDFNALVQIKWHVLKLYTSGTPQPGWQEMAFGGMEYSYLGDVGVAEPHFSTTWWNTIAGGILRFLTPIAAPVASTVQTIGNNFDIVTAILTPLEEIINNAFAGLNSIIVVPLSQVLEGIGTFITQVGVDVFNAFVTGLSSFISDAFDIIVAIQLAGLYLVIEGLGALFGISGLWTSVVSTFSAFATSITAFGSFLSSTFTMIVDFMNTVISYAVLYGPFAINMFVIFLAVDVSFAIAKGDTETLINQGKTVLSAFYRVVQFVFNIINHVVQVVASLVPL